MSSLNRRQCFTTFLGGLLGAAGTVVLASAALPARAAAGPHEEDAKDLEKRADQVAGALAPPPGDEDQQLTSFLNGGFGNGGGGDFRKGAFANGGFQNGGFRKAGWVNGGWRN
jgi:rSAM-associated Gly-rich repeat protein